MLDVLIVGAGLSGIGAARHLQRNCPTKCFAILERRDAMGGTWDLFRYPGIRSDSDMHTLGYAFKPWGERKAIADGPSILRYIRAAVSEFHLRLCATRHCAATQARRPQAVASASELSGRPSQLADKFLRMPVATAGAIIVACIERERERILVGMDAKICSLVERVSPVNFWRFLERGMPS